MNDAVKKILEIAVCAPSGENCQPWKFRTSTNNVEIWNIPERDNSLYNWGQRASYVAHGALLENISIVAPVLGYSPQITILPNPAQADYVAHIVLQESQPTPHALYQFVKERTTNRKPYKNVVLTKEQKEELSHACEGLERGKVVFREQAQDVKVIAEAAAGNERILFENPHMHKFFYDHITWTKQEDQKKKIGFYIKTFELRPPAEKMFQFAKSPFFVQNANRFGFSKMVARKNSKIYASCSAVGAILMQSNSPQDFILAGRLMQRVWLIVTKLGLSLQPLTGILFLAQGVCQEQTDKLTLNQKNFIREQYERIKEVLEVRNETVAMLFRVGDGRMPTARSLRLAPQISES